MCVHVTDGAGGGKSCCGDGVIREVSCQATQTFRQACMERSNMPKQIKLEIKNEQKQARFFFKCIW